MASDQKKTTPVNLDDWDSQPSEADDDWDSPVEGVVDWDAPVSEAPAASPADNKPLAPTEVELAEVERVEDKEVEASALSPEMPFETHTEDHDAWLAGLVAELPEGEEDFAAALDEASGGDQPNNSLNPRSLAPDDSFLADEHVVVVAPPAASPVTELEALKPASGILDESSSPAEEDHFDSTTDHYESQSGATADLSAEDDLEKPSLPKKVELDVDGIFLDSADEPVEAPADTPSLEPEPAPVLQPPSPEPSAQLAPPKPEKAKRVKFKIPKSKLLILLIPAVLIMAGLVFAAYLFLFKSKPPVVPPEDKAPVVEIKADYQPSPGEYLLDNFYINIPGESQDAFIELSLVILYSDSPDLQYIQNNQIIIRDLVYRLVQAKGAEFAKKNELQIAFRKELTEAINEEMGINRIVGIQIRLIKTL